MKRRIIFFHIAYTKFDPVITDTWVIELDTYYRYTIVMKIIILLCLLFVNTSLAMNITLRMYPAYHGDMMLLNFPDGKVAVIDTGYEGKPRKFLYADLATSNIKTIDYLILTHNDIDHIGGAPEVLRDFHVKEVWTTDFPRPKEKSYQKLQKAIADTGTIQKHFYDGDVLDIGGTHITFYNPPRDKSKSNDSSMVFKVEYKNFSMLFTGDLQKAGQKRLHQNYGQALQSKVYKVPHHGDYSYRPFIKDVSPEISLCPCFWVFPGIFPSLPNYLYLKRVSEYHSVRTGQITLISDGYDTVVY